MTYTKGHNSRTNKHTRTRTHARTHMRPHTRAHAHLECAVLRRRDDVLAVGREVRGVHHPHVPLEDRARVQCMQACIPCVASAVGVWVGGAPP